MPWRILSKLQHIKLSLGCRCGMREYLRWLAYGDGFWSCDRSSRREEEESPDRKKRSGKARKKIGVKGVKGVEEAEEAA